MLLQSMTGFARSQGAHEGSSWVWEIRSVNGKGLDARVRLPSGMAYLDAEVRGLLSKAFSRGNFQISLQFQAGEAIGLPKVNHAVADEYWRQAKELSERLDASLPSVSDLMMMRGVVELEENDLSDVEKDNLKKAILASFSEVVQLLSQSRGNEGTAIGAVLSEQLANMQSLTQSIIDNPAITPDAIAAGLKQQVAKLVESTDSMDPQRLHQEAVILAAKADLQEELDRLSVHLKSAADLIAKGGPVGRKLDFLAQEFNRECNTICSKSNAAEVTSLGLDMKLVIDQFREQVQNME